MINRYTIIAFILMLVPLTFGQLTKAFNLSFNQILVVSVVWVLAMLTNFGAFLFVHGRLYFKRRKLEAASRA
ncbi:hypothetical protein ACFPTO_01555 [Paraburkholderia denitrificans]|uniref:Uncharacterized protein n=1 Tax=Paraburkholderia denitrificans TaxID=694025 RepID=A0ABW0J379_9BURK